ncbi:MAG: cobalamin-dependent protein, partial [archaeon]
MKGIIIYPPNQLMDVETPRPDGSLGPLYLASALEARGIKTDILDASVGGPRQSLKDTFYRSVRQSNGLTRIGMSFEEIAEHVAQKGYDFVGISSNFTPQTRMAFETAQAIRQKNPNIKIYAGGVNARALYERFLATGNFDAVCLTEGEKIFPELVESQARPPEMREIKGIAFNLEGRVVVNPADKSCIAHNLDELHMPSWDKMAFNKYDGINSPHGVDITPDSPKRYAPIMTSRGCPYSCLYCHNSDEGGDNEKGPIGRLRLSSIERVVQEIEALKALGVSKLFFEDDSLLAKKDRAKEIFRRARGYGLAIANVNGVNLIDFYNRSGGVDKPWAIDHEFIEVLRDAGFSQLVFPAESGSRRILKKYASGKVNLDKMNLPLLMREMSQKGILAPVNIMIGFPDETRELVFDTIELKCKEFYKTDSKASLTTVHVPDETNSIA